MIFLGLNTPSDYGKKTSSSLEDILKDAPKDLDSFKEIQKALDALDKKIAQAGSTEVPSIEGLLSAEDAEATYQKKGDYVESAAMANAIQNALTSLSLSDYALKSELPNEFDDSELKDLIAEVKTALEGKQPAGDYLTEPQDLSDYALKSEIPSTEGFISAEDADSKYQVKGEYLTEHQSLEEYAKTSEISAQISTAIAALINGASSDFDTFKKIADWISQHGSTASDIITAINDHAKDIEELQAEVSTKVNSSDLDEFRHESYTPEEIRSIVDVEYNITLGSPDFPTLSSVFLAVNPDVNCDNVSVAVSNNIDTDAILTLVAGKSMDIDLNGNTIQSASGKKLSSMITATGTLTIEDSSEDNSGVIKNNSDSQSVLKSTSAKGAIILNSGTVEASVGNNNGAIYQTNGSLEINGGKVISSGTGIASKNVTISGGEIIANKQGACCAGVISGGKITSSTSYPVYTNQNGILEINGGEFFGPENVPTVQLYTGDLRIGENAVLPNGVGFASNATSMILAGGAAESYLDSTNAGFYKDGELIGYAPINTSILTSTKVSGTTVSLTKEVPVSTYIRATKSCTLDLNENNISCVPSGVNTGAALVVDGSAPSPVEFTVRNGNISCDDPGQGCNAIQVGMGTTLNIESGNYSVPGNNSTIYIVKALKTAPTVVNISGGTFSSGDGKYVLNIKDDMRQYAAFNVTGGTFIGFDPAHVTNEGDEVISYVPEGFESVELEPGVFTVRPRQ